MSAALIIMNRQRDLVDRFRDAGATSAGAATVLTKGEQSVELIRRSDEKLYEAKSSGRNRVAK
jgi:PleD family two-component response regulator